jgi:pimeloyl-ACP methyl ester carboxylesterase
MTIPFTDFGGNGPLLHFAHANGYPPRAYAPLIEHLTPRYHVIAALARPLWPGSRPNGFRDWTPLTEDLLRFLDEQQAEGTVGVGHSMGGVATLDAALRRPELFRALVLIDPVIFRIRLLWAWELVKNLGIGDRLHPLIPGALRRRRVFTSLEEMYARYRRAPVFSRIDDRGLRAYVEALARPRTAAAPNGEVELAYPPEWEAAIYRHGPLNLWERMPQLKLPLLVIYGAESDTFRAPAQRKMQHLIPHAQFHKVGAAGHLVPLEKPGEVADLIIRFLDDFS